jgi:hypothetical protein
MRRLSPLALCVAASPLLAVSCLLTAPSDDELVASCDDDRKNGGESDADCGGPCAPCGTGRTCGSAGDCASGVCAQGSCAEPTCVDGVTNGTETDIDCGDLEFLCFACVTGQRCLRDFDCESFSCIEEVCAAPSCTDGIINGNESDQDCGGSCPVKCGPGQVCFEDADCASGVCVTSMLQCQ